MDKQTIETLETTFLSWLNINIPHLPLNALSWKVQIIDRTRIREEDILTLGKYNTEQASASTFYKSYSRIISLDI